MNGWLVAVWGSAQLSADPPLPLGPILIASSSILVQTHKYLPLPNDITTRQVVLKDLNNVKFVVVERDFRLIQQAI